ncbi:MAG: oligopeptide/dipeptide ABC transporter ATP-binding protein [Alphaproteobacteria bacterium]
MTVADVVKSFQPRHQLAALFGEREAAPIRAVDGVSFEIGKGELLGLIGESGSGKTTLARLLTRLEVCDRGEILFLGRRNVAEMRRAELRDFYRNVQMIFQDPYESLNPRFTVLETVIEPLRAQGIGNREGRAQKVAASLARAGLRPPERYLRRFPHELSGGERQRLSIARALVLEPRLIVADEPVSMLDVSIRAGILNLLKELSLSDGLAVLYISHDLSTTRYLCDRIIIMYQGRFVEIGSPEQVLDAPKHPYARMLRAAVPSADPEERRASLPEQAEEAGEPLAANACAYAPECPQAMAVCRARAPLLVDRGAGHRVACHLYDPEVVP